MIVSNELYEIKISIMVIAMTDIQLVRIFLGGIDAAELPDVVISMFLARYADFEQPLKIFNTCISCLQWLIAQAIAQGHTYTERSEKIADEETSIKGKSKAESFQDLLDYILEHPVFIDPSLDSLKYRVVIGGVRQDQSRAVKADPNSRGPLDERSPFANNNCYVTGFNYD